MTPVPESVEEAVEALKGLRSAAAFDPEDVRISQDEKDLCAKAQRGIDTALAALAQGPKEDGPAPTSWPTREHVAAIVREVRNNTIDTPDAIDRLLALFPAQPPSLTFSDEQVERAARAHHDGLYGSPGTTRWDEGSAVTRDRKLAAMRAALSALETK